MAIAIRVTPTFARSKEGASRDKKTLDDAVGEIAAKPEMGGAKNGDLAGVYAYKFKLNKQEALLSYQFSASELVLLSLGSHENFCRDLKLRILQQFDWSANRWRDPDRSVKQLDRHRGYARHIASSNSLAKTWIDTIEFSQ